MLTCVLPTLCTLHISHISPKIRISQMTCLSTWRPSVTRREPLCCRAQPKSGHSADECACCMPCYMLCSMHLRFCAHLVSFQDVLFEDLATLPDQQGALGAQLGQHGLDPLLLQLGCCRLHLLQAVCRHVCTSVAQQRHTWCPLQVTWHAACTAFELCNSMAAASNCSIRYAGQQSVVGAEAGEARYAITVRPGVKAPIWHNSHPKPPTC